MLAERRPPVLLDSPDSIQEAYAYHRNRHQSPLGAAIVYPIVEAVFRGRTAYEEGARADIADHLANGGQGEIAFEHLSITDPFAVGAQAKRDPALQPMVAKTVVPAKAPLYRIRPIAWFLEHMDAKPALRDKDKHDPKFKPHSDPEEVKRLMAQAGDAVVDICIDHVNNGGHVLLFPRGERKAKDDDSLIEPDHLRLGDGRIAVGVDHPDQLLIMPGAINYDRGWRHPSIFFARPLRVPPDVTPKSILAVVAGSMQQSAEQAAELSRWEPGSSVFIPRSV